MMVGGRVALVSTCEREVFFTFVGFRDGHRMIFVLSLSGIKLTVTVS